MNFTSIIFLISFTASSFVLDQTATKDQGDRTMKQSKANRGRNILLMSATSMEKIRPDQIPSNSKKVEPLKISLARGEVEAGQIIIAAPTKELQDVSFFVSKLKNQSGDELPRSAVDLSVIGYVHTDSNVKLAYKVDRSGWFPDPILPFVKRFNIEKDHIQSLWLSIRVPEGQPAGVYNGQLTVSANNEVSQKLPVVVIVFDFTIPRKRSFQTTVNTFTDFLKQIHGPDWNDSMYWKYAEFLLAHRVNMDNAYRKDEPPPTVSQIRRLVAGGQDGWGLRFIQQMGKGFSDAGPDSSKYREYLSKAFGEAKAAHRILAEAGADKIAYAYFFDEVRENHWPLLRETALQFRKELPGVPLWTSAFDKEYGAKSGLSEVIDCWVGIIAHFKTPEDRAKAERNRSMGGKVGWYTTVWPPRPYPNFFIEYDAIEPRILMGAMTQKYKPDAFGYWCLNWWFQSKEQKLLTEGPYTNWKPFFESSHGEGSWIYAGKQGPITSMRFENFRDGLEDFEYYKLLEKALIQAEAKGAPKEELDHARALLAIPDEVVQGLTNFVRDPQIFSNHRGEVAKAIERLLGFRP